MRLPRLVLGVGAVTVSVAMGWTVVVGTEPSPTGHEPSRELVGVASAEQALDALRKWDAGRARAWASADVAALRALYAPGSAAGARDASMLRDWRDRGLRVEGMQTQVLAARVVEQASGRVVLLVTDRLARAVAVGRGPRVALPRDSVTTRRVTLRQVDGLWLVSSVLPSARRSAQR